MNMPLPPNPQGDLSAPGRLGHWVGDRIEALAHTARHPLFWVGAREMSGISVGLTAWSFMTGVAMVKSGMSLTEAVLMSLLVFASSASVPANSSPQRSGNAAPMKMPSMLKVCQKIQLHTFPPHR